MIPPSDRLSLETLISLTGKNKNMRNNRTKDSSEKNQVKGANPPKIKIIGWFKFPVFIAEDHRVEQLIQHEGMKGFGLYVSILCRIYYKKSECITRDELLSIKEKGCTKDTLKKVAFNYGLFDIDENNHVTSAIDYTGTNDDLASQDKAALLLSEHDVKRYFTNCLNNPTTARKLQEHLAAQRAKEQEMQQQEMRRLMES